MPAPEVPIERITGRAPLASPIGLLENEGDLIRLGVPELGSVEVSAHGIRVIAPDNDRIEKTWYALGAWASSQWFMTRGLFSMRGTVVAKQGCALVLSGKLGVGVSVTAAQLTRHGWGIVSDGLVAIDAEGSALRIDAQESTVRIDRIVAEGLFADMPSQQVASTRDRKEITLPGHGDAKVAYYVGIGIRESAAGISINRAVLAPGEQERPPGNLLWSPLLKNSRNPEPPVAPTFIAMRPMPRTMDDAPRIGPPAMARAIVEVLDELEVVVG
jgi:hypothetical protein